MRLALDTSVLVAALVEPHPFHARAIRWLEEMTTGRASGECTWHAVAEAWSVLTRIPVEPSISPALGWIAVQRLLEHVEAVPTSGEVYRRAIGRCAEVGLRSGTVFDALHLVSAESREVQAFVTFNPADFERLRVDGSPPVVVPPDPPAFVLPDR